MIRWAQKEDLSFDRSNTAAATRAKIVDGANRKQQITQRIYGMLERTLDRAEYAQRTAGRQSSGPKAALRAS